MRRHHRDLLIEARPLATGERLRVLMNPRSESDPYRSGSSDTDPVAALKRCRGDEEGLEILAIMIDILCSTGFVRVDAGTPDEAYVWPYFAEEAAGALAHQKVELLRIVTAGDVNAGTGRGTSSAWAFRLTDDGNS